MNTIKTLSAAAALAAVVLAATDLSASAQSLTNGSNGQQPNGLSSKNPNGPNGKSPSKGLYRTPTRRSSTMKPRNMSYSSRRPLTVRPSAQTDAAVVAAPAAVVANTGPGTLITGPLGFGSNLVALPFRGLGTIFPATGDIATNPLVIVGGPLRAVADLVQVPFRVIGAPFGGTTIATY